MRPALRRLSLTAHVASSVGWLGAVAGFLALAIAGRTSQDAEIVRGAYLAMNLLGAFVIVPLGLAALLTGLVQSLGTHWGLLRHYWVVVKFTLTIGAIVLLLLHQFTAVAGAARRVSGAAAGTVPDAGGLGTQLVFDAGLAVLVLLVNTTLSVYKPWGTVRGGRRAASPESVQPRGAAGESAAGRVPVGLTVFLLLVGAFLAAVVVLHLTGRGLGGHGM